MFQERQDHPEKSDTRGGNTTKETIIRLLLMLSPSVLSRIEKPKAGEELTSYKILKILCSLIR